MEQIMINTPTEGFVEITGPIQKIVTKAEIPSGLCQIFVPHTTAAITINENADPDVLKDMLAALKQLVPKLPYRHGEGNSPAHILSTLVGCSVTVPIAERRLCLGTWQGIYLCEFDGPRRRKIWVQLVGK